MPNLPFQFTATMIEKTTVDTRATEVSDSSHISSFTGIRESTGSLLEVLAVFRIPYKLISAM